MRIFKGLENIHAVIDRHESEWRREQGEEPSDKHPRVSLEESVRRRLTEPPVTEGSGKFSADRFLGGKTDPVKPEPETVPEPEATPEPEAVSEPEATLEPEATPELEATPEPEATSELEATPETEAMPEPEATPEPEAAPEPEATPEPETVTEESPARHSWLYNEVMKAVNQASGGSKDAKIIAVFIPVAQEGAEAREIPGDDTEAPGEGGNVQAVEIIRNKDGKHSQLYDEVMRAVNDAAGDSRKIVAVFVPLLQDGKEFEDLPADETVTLQPVSEEAVKIETVPEAEKEPEADFDLIPNIEAGNDPVVVEAFREIEENLDGENDTEAESKLVPPEEPDVPDIEPVTDDTGTEILADEPLDEPLPDVPDIEPAADDTETEILADEPLDEPLPDIEPATDDTETEIVADELTDEIAQLEQLPDLPDIPDIESEPESEIITEEAGPETEYDDADDVLQDGEPMVYQDIDAVGDDESEQEEITLPAELDDDEIVGGDEFDETLTEIHTATDEDDTIILDGDEEIELLPDPVKQ